MCLAISVSAPEYCSNAQMPAKPKTTRSMSRSTRKYGRTNHKNEKREAAARHEVEKKFKTVGFNVNGNC